MIEMALDMKHREKVKAREEEQLPVYDKTDIEPEKEKEPIDESSESADEAHD